MIDLKLYLYYEQDPLPKLKKKKKRNQFYILTNAVDRKKV